MLLVYNRTLLEDDRSRSAYRERYGEDLDVPRNWEAFRRIAEFFTRKDGTDGPTYGVVLEGSKDGWLYFEWCNFAFGMGGGVMKKKYGWEGNLDTRLLIDSPETVAATRLYMSLAPFNAGDFFSTGVTEQRELLRSRRVALAIVWSDVLFELIKGPGGERYGFARSRATSRCWPAGPTTSIRNRVTRRRPWSTSCI